VINRRFRLIWLALVAPIDVVEAKSNKLLNAMNNVYVAGGEKRLERITSSSWDLLGIRISHNDNADVGDIESFLKQSPDIIKNLITIIKQ